MQQDIDSNAKKTSGDENLDTKYVVIVVDPQIPSQGDVKLCREIEIFNGQSIIETPNHPSCLLNEAVNVIKNSEYKTTVYSCTKCFKIFSDKHLLDKHEESCEEVPADCVQARISKDYKHNKSKSVHPVALYSIRKSSKRIIRREREKQMNRIVSNQIPLVLESSLTIVTPRSYLCKRCFSTWESVFELHWHSVEKHDYQVKPTNDEFNYSSEENDLIHICQRCLKCFLSANDLNKHMNDHRTESPFVCKLCEEEFNMNCFRSRQYRKSYGKLTPSRFICSFCEATFSTKRCLIGHLHVHTKDKITTICGYCEQTFRQRTNVRSHMQQTHKETIECSYCSQHFQHKCEVDEHVKKIHDVNNENQSTKQNREHPAESKLREILLLLLSSDFTKIGLPQRSLTDIISEMASLVSDSSHSETNNAHEITEDQTSFDFSSHLRILIKHLVSQDILEDINFEQSSVTELINIMYKIMYCYEPVSKKIF